VIDKSVQNLNKFKENSGVRKTGWVSENEEAVKLRKVVQSKDERISQLESNLMELKKCHNEQIQHNEASTRNETDAL
jgi:hypothetical protein